MRRSNKSCSILYKWHIPCMFRGFRTTTLSRNLRVSPKSSNLENDGSNIFWCPSNSVVGRIDWQGGIDSIASGFGVRSPMRNLIETAYCKERCPNIPITWDPPELLHQVNNVCHNRFLRYLWRTTEMVWKTKSKLQYAEPGWWKK